MDYMDYIQVNFSTIFFWIDFEALLGGIISENVEIDHLQHKDDRKITIETI